MNKRDRELSELISKYFEYIEMGYSVKDAERWAFIAVYDSFPRF